MSVRAIDAVWRSNIDDEYELLVMLALADWADDDGVAYPKMDQLAQKSRQSKRKVQYVVQSVVSKGLLSVTPGGGRGNPNVFQINLERLRQTTSTDTLKGAPCARNKPQKQHVSDADKGAQRAPNRSTERAHGMHGNDEERVHENGLKGARLPHARGEPSVEPSRLVINNQENNNTRGVSTSRAREGHDLGFLTDADRATYGADILRILEEYPQTACDMAYRAILPRRHFGSLTPLGWLTERITEHGWPKVVAALVMTADMADSPSQKYADRVLENLGKPKAGLAELENFK